MVVLYSLEELKTWKHKEQYKVGISPGQRTEIIWKTTLRMTNHTHMPLPQPGKTHCKQTSTCKEKKEMYSIKRTKTTQKLDEFSKRETGSWV